MPTASAALTGSANYRTAPSGPSCPPIGTTLAAVHRVFPEHARKLVGKLLNLSEGGAKKKLEGERRFEADELAAMLRDPRGFELLTAIMGDAKPRWWVLCSAFMQVREAQRLQAKARAKIRNAVRSALDADADLTAAIARADILSDPDFHRPHVDALRAMGGLPDRTLAQTTSKGATR